MTDQITLTGLVATTPRHLVTSEGLPITSFRLASTARRYDRAAQEWVDGDTNWYTITAFRALAINVVGSVAKGQRIVLTGQLRVRDWESGERTGTTVEVDTDAIGHDLSWGTSVFTRSVGLPPQDKPLDPGANPDAEQPDAEQPAEPVDAEAKPSEPVSARSAVLRSLQDAGRLRIIPVGRTA